MATKWRSSLTACPAFGPDSAESWMTAVCCGFLLLLSFSAMSVSGVFFYGIVETFGAARESASWPVTLNCSLVLLAGPIMGFLSKRYSCRKVLHACAFISGPAVGIALSGLYVGANVLVAQHFEKRRTTACSVMFTIGGLSAIVFPALADVSYAAYGIHGAFLLYGATLLNAIPFVFLLKSPLWLDAPKQKRVLVLDSSTPCKVDDEFSEEECDQNGVREAGVNLESRSTQDWKENATNASTGAVLGERAVSRVFLKDRLRINVAAREVKHAVKPFLTCVFWLDAMSFSAVTMGMVMFVSTSTDYAIDQGISSANAVFLLHAYSVSDILIRPLTGVAVDSNLLSLESTMLLGFLFQGVAFEILAWFSALHGILIASALMGATCGSRIALQAPALVKNFGMERLPTMIGAMSWCMGIVLLLRPPIVGYFRDTLGSYSGLMHAAAACNGVFAVIWMVKPVQKRTRCW
ncbi:monocarboxylate transporter 14-like isoform X2 [Amblyomma americanum]